MLAELSGAAWGAGSALGVARVGACDGAFGVGLGIAARRASGAGGDVCGVFVSAPLRLGPRDAHLGWDGRTRGFHIEQVVSNELRAILWFMIDESLGLWR